MTTIEKIAMIIPGKEGSGISLKTNFFTDWNKIYRLRMKNVMALNEKYLNSKIQENRCEIA